uniref:Cytochrome P450 n=1 Tax=Tanacetum cinerariifolium TaxID=118510 RepID=A0A6L2JW62_TANCI|nr:cytochrome P450 [Tanacetum cinerariifolium]
MFVEFVIQNQFFSYSLEDFSQILEIPCEGACVFTDRWSLDELAYGVPPEGPYQTNLPSPDDIISYIREDREGQATRIRHKEETEVQNYQILTREIMSTLKPLEEIIQENVFCLGEQNTRKDFGTRRGRQSTSSSSAFDQPSSSHLNDDDDGNGEGTSRASIPLPIQLTAKRENRKFLSVQDLQKIRKTRKFSCLQITAPINMGRPPNISGTTIRSNGNFTVTT